MIKWARWLIVVVIFLALYWWLSQEKPIMVDITYADKGRVEHTVANTRAGTITACQRAKMSLPIGGQIESINVKEGDLVEQGQVLISLWHKDRLSKKQEVLAHLQASKSSKTKSCLLAEQAQQDYQRQKSLLAQKLTSQEILDQALTKSKAADADCQVFSAQVKANQAMVNTIEASIEQTQLIAPFTGTVAEITGEIGEYTTPSPPGVPTPPAIDLLTHDCHYVTAPIDEVDAAHLAIGKPVKITLDAFREQTFAGTLRRISPYVQDFEKQARTVTVEVELAHHTEPHLLAGYSADVEVILDAKDNVLRLPSDLIINNRHVLVLNDQGTIEQREIEVGISNWQYTEVVKGLSTQDKVVASIGLTGVKAGNFAKAKQE